MSFHATVYPTLIGSNLCSDGRMCVCLPGVQGEKKWNDCSQPIIGNTTFSPGLSFCCSCFVARTQQLHCIDMSCVINYSCVFLSLTVKKAVSTVSERLSLPPAGWKYEENRKVSGRLCSVSSPRLFTNVLHSGVCFFYILPPLLVMSVFSAERSLIRKWNSGCVSDLQVSFLSGLLSDSCRNLFDHCKKQTALKI